MTPQRHNTPGPPGQQRARLLRLATIATITVTAGLILVFVLQIARFDALRPPKRQPGEEAAPSSQITADRSTIAGYDNQQQPFVVDARVAEQDPDKGNIVHLTTVDGRLKKADGTVMTVAASGGTYDTDTRVLDLKGDVKLVSQGKFVARMDKARVFLQQKKLYADVPVTVDLQHGTINAGGLEITDEGNRILFFNRVKTTYTPSDSTGTPADSIGDRQ